MKISFNPSNSNKNILDLIKNNKDIIFDLKGHSIFARGVEFKGTDTNTWRPVVDNLTSDSTTSSLSAKQGKVLKALIDGKSNSDHNHDGRYLKLTGGKMASNALITFADSGSWYTDKKPQGARGGLYWTGQSDYAKLYAEETVVDNLDLVIQFGDDNSNGLSIRNKDNTQTSYISSSGVITTGTFKGNLDWSYITNKPATATRWPSWAEVTGKPSSFTPSTHTHGLSNSVFFLNMPSINGNAKWKEVFGYPVNYNLLLSVRINNPAPEWCVGNFGSGILYGGSDTKGFMSSAYNEPFIMWAGGNGSSDDSVPKWYIGIKGTHKSIYNLATIASEANAAYNLRHSHANKSVLDGITSALVNSWNTAYNFVSNITGTDTDKVINKWEEIVNFLAGITEDNKLNTLLNSKLSVYELADNTNVGTIKNNGIYYSTTDASSRTLINSPFNTGFAFINMTSYDGGDDLRRSRLAFNAFGEIKVSDDRDQANTAETWYNVLTSKNSGINGSTIKLNGTSITVYSSGTADGRYVKKSGDTMSGVLTIDTPNFGALTIKRNDDANGASIQFRGKSSVYGYIGLNNSTKDKQFLRWSSDTSRIYTILDTSSTYVSNNKGYINGLEITQVNNADTLDGYHAASFVKMYTGKFRQYNEGTWTKILQFTIPSGHLQPTISFIWHPTECARNVWADFNINIRSGSPIFYVNWKGTTRRTVYCVGDGTTYSVWVQGTKSSWDPFGLVQVISTWQINTYQAGSLQYSDSEPTGTYKVVASMSGIIMYADRLLTARKINGTSFDGTSDITTAYWGTTRTISLTGAITGSVSTNGGGNITINTTYGTGNITNLDNRYVKKAGDTMQGNLTFTSGKQTRWTAKGISYITDGNIDSGTSLGGNLANLVISSWYGVSFTTSCSGQTYTNKTAVGINCRTGIVYAANFVGPLQGNAATATKLQTSRSIWGQSFDGTRDVSGTLSGVANIQFSADGAYDIGSNSATSRYIYTNWLGAKSGSKLELGANNSGFGQGLCIDTNLNVGIGTNSPTQKLDVIGNIRATGQLYLPTNGNYNAILMGDDCWMGDCNISNVIGLSGTNNANSGGIKFGKGGMYIGYNGSSHYSSGTSLWTNFNADTVDGEHASNFSYTHQSSFDFSKRKSGRIVTFDQSGTDYGWINGFASTYNNYLTSVIFNEHRSSNWYVGYMEGDMSTGETNGLQAVHKLAFADGDENYPIFLGYLNLHNGDDGTISSSFPCLGYSVPFTYTRGGAYCLINIPNTSFQTFHIKAAIASVHYSGSGMDNWVGNHRGDGAWWLHCDAVGSNAVQVKGFHPGNPHNNSWWGGNPLYSTDGAAKIITVCLFGYVKFR